MDRTTLAGDFCDAGEPTTVALLEPDGEPVRGAANAGNLAEWSGLAAGSFTVSTCGSERRSSMPSCPARSRWLRPVPSDRDHRVAVG
jgi:hypothetical protein